ncbi:MAG: hypothetical protein ABL999_06330 [Pyrinomonadaceae bacterium]
MKEQIAIDSELWNEFESASKRNRRNPLKLITEYIRETMEIWEDQKLDKEIQRDARKSGYTEDDAVELVKQYRAEKAKRYVST